MARDYAKRTRTARSNPTGVPAWAWVLIGLMLGLFMAFLFYLNNFVDTSPLREEAGGRATVEVRVAPERSAPEEPPAAPPMRYDFYRVLPKFEVAVPEEEAASPPTRSRPSRPITEPGPYVLQAGSFRMSRDADTRRAQLALLGLFSRIETVESGEDVWHRVRLGPFDDLERLNEARERLRENGIEFLVLQGEPTS